MLNEIGTKCDPQHTAIVQTLIAIEPSQKQTRSAQKQTLSAQKQTLSAHKHSQTSEKQANTI